MVEVSTTRAGTPVPFFVSERLGEKRSKTPEGFLVCHDVPLARIGEQLYRPNEVPPSIKPKPGTDYIRVMRDADEVFSPEAMASLEGKPITIDHPAGLEVNPSNYRELAHGHVQNVRRGEGAQSDVILGDLVVKSSEAIEYAQPGIEVSLGYDCGYQELGADHELPSGLARQYGYIFNHAALLDAGRCGPRCSIGDHSECSHQPGDATMTATNDKRSVLDRLRSAFTAKDPKTFDAAFAELSTTDGETDEGTVVIHNHLTPAAAGHATADASPTLDGAPDWFRAFATATDRKIDVLAGGIMNLKKVLDRKAKDEDDDEDDDKKKKNPFAKSGDEDDDDDDDEKKKKKTEDDKILGELELEAPLGVTGDGIRKLVKAGDSSFLEDSFSATVAAAEILAPGIAVPTFDSKTKPRATFDAICGLRRKALDFAMRDPASAALIEQVTGAGRTVDTAKSPCGHIRSVFHAVVGLKKARNNDSSTTRVTDSGSKKGPQIKTIADLNAYNAQYREPGSLKKAS